MQSNRHTEQPGSLVEQLAQGKATAVELDPDDMLVAADTIIYVDGQVRGKPADLDEARRALLSYSNNEHDVYTGVCIRFRQTCKTFHVRSRVTFGQNSHELIEWYLSTGEYKVRKRVSPHVITPLGSGQGRRLWDASNWRCACRWHQRLLLQHNGIAGSSAHSRDTGPYVKYG